MADFRLLLACVRECALPRVRECVLRRLVSCYIVLLSTASTVRSWARRQMIFFSLFKTLEGKTVTVELKNDLQVRVYSSRIPIALA